VVALVAAAEALADDADAPRARRLEDLAHVAAEQAADDGVALARQRRVLQPALDQRCLGGLLHVLAPEALRLLSAEVLDHRGRAARPFKLPPRQVEALNRFRAPVGRMKMCG